MNPASFAKRLAEAQTRHPWRFLFVALGLTALAGVVASGLEFDSSYEALLPEDAPEVQNADDVRARTGGTRQLVLAIGGAEPEQRLAFGRRLAERLARVDRIRCVDLEFNIEFFEDRGLWLMDVETLDRLIPALEEAVRIAKEQANPLALHLDEEAEKAELEAAWQKVDDITDEKQDRLPFDGVLNSEDGKYTFLLVVPSIKFSDLQASATLLAAIEAVVDELDPAAAGLEVRYAGNLKVLQEQHQTMRADLRNASALALVFGVLIVAGFTRRPLAPLLVGCALVSGVAWTFALARLFVGHVNIITGFLVAVLIGLGIDFGIHLYVRYQQERRRPDNDVAGAAIAAVRGTFPPALTSALTTAGTFFSFTLAEFRGFSEFGLIAGTGVMLTLASSFLILPPLFVLVGRRGRKAAAIGPAPAPAPFRIGPRIAIGVVVALLAFAAFGATTARDIPFRNNFKELRGKSDATEFFEYVDDNLGVGFNPAVLLANDAADAERMIELARAAEDAPTPGRVAHIGKVLGATDLLPRDIEEHRPRVERLEKILMDPKLDRAERKEGERAEQLGRARRMAQTEPWTFDEVPAEFRRRFTTRDGKQYLVFVWPAERNDADYQAAAWEAELDDLSADLDRAGIAHQLADETLMVAWIYRLILADGLPLLLIAAGVVALFLLLDFRSFKQTALLLVPLATGMAVFAGAIRALGLELNMYNMVVLPSVIGIGIDNAVHIYHRYLAEGRGTVPMVVRNTGAAALLASLTTAVGFGSALISHNVGLQTMGLLAVVGIGATFIAAVIYFPCLLTLLERFGKQKNS